MFSKARTVVIVASLLAVATVQTTTQPSFPRSITTPREFFGAAVGDDYFLATYAELEAYWKQLDRASDRLTLVDIGRTEEGRTQWMAVVTAPENFAQLERYKRISRRLALAEDLGEAEARALAREGKTVVWIDGGLHASEVLTAQQLIEAAYELVSDTDDETMRILRDVIVLLVHANPDGHELVANWYMREKNPRRRTLAGLPRLYQKYAGHDNNRDFYMGTQAETINMSRILFQEWIPQIVYDHHQAPATGLMVAPPFDGPSNYLLDPLVSIGIDIVGQAIHARFAAAGKPGVTMGHGSPYSTWWNGGLRTTPNFHNQIGILTETAGGPATVTTSSGQFRFRQAIDYSMTANRAVLDIAARERESWLFNIYRMGRNGIERGSRDWWTASPHRPAGDSGSPRLRDPRGYILPADQPDFLTATKFVNALIRTGVTVFRAADDFKVGTRKYPAGSYVIKTAQAFRPHVLDMFEPQDHPDEVVDEGGMARLPYDSAGWTLAFQMGVKFDRVLDAFDGPFAKIDGVAEPPRGRVVRAHGAAGYVVSHYQNDAIVAVNRLVRAGEKVSWLGDGAIYVAAGPRTLPLIERAATEVGLTFTGVTTPPRDAALQLNQVRVGLVDRYGGWSTGGWIRWLLERYEFPFDVVYPPSLDAGNLASRYDAIILPAEAVPHHGGGWDDLGGPAMVPPEYANEVGEMTRVRTLPALKQFVEDGGTLLAIGRATSVARHFALPVSEPLALLPPGEFLVPGSVMRVAVDNTLPLGYGFEKEVDVYFNHSPVFQIREGSSTTVRPVAWFANATPLRSGWALGQAHLKGMAAAVDVSLGRGHVLLFGPDITFRAQSHGTFKFLFNGIYSGKATEIRLR
jgi:zinc carboxypeptidase